MATQERGRLEAQALLAAIVDSSDDAIVSKTLDGIILSWNGGAERLFGYTAEEAIGQSITLIIPPELHPEERAIQERLRRGERINHFETVRITKDGRLLNISLTISPVRDEHGQVVGASKIARDITERNRAEQALRNQKQELETLLETLPIPVLLAHDPECRRISGNRAASALLRMAFEGNLSKSTVDAPDQTSHFRVVKDGQALPFEDLPIQRAARGEVVRNEETQTVFEDGTVVHTLISAQPLLDASGRARGAIGCMLDITELRKAERALRVADRRKDEFLATLAHELRNPLAPILNSLQILRVVEDPDSARHVHSVIERQTHHMARLVDDLLELSRISRGTIELRQEPVDLAAVITSALETSRPLIDAGGHELSVSIAPGALRVHGDPVRLSQVLANLLNNAAKYTDPGGRITVRASAEDREAVVTVSDTGIGISPEMLPHLFEMFSRAPNPLRRGQEGLGIGLNLVRRLVEMHGGRVLARSAGFGQGSQFEVRLPLDEAHGPVEPLDDRGGFRPKVESGRRERILVVDDNLDAVETLAMLLRLGGAEVDLAYDGVTALDAIRRYRPSIVFTDLGLPGMDGYELARQVRQDPTLAPIVLIALTGWGSESDRLRTKQAGFDHHLVKPVDFEHVRALLRSLSPRTDGD